VWGEVFTSWISADGASARAAATPEYLHGELRGLMRKMAGSDEFRVGEAVNAAVTTAVYYDGPRGQYPGNIFAG
jgi:hypothetical protein